MPKSKTSKARSSGQTDTVAQNAAGGAGKLTPAPPDRLYKLLTIIVMLRRPEGATLADLVDVTGWKPNSVRGAISGAIRKRRLMKVASEVVDGVRTYRITG